MNASTHNTNKENSTTLSLKSLDKRVSGLAESLDKRVSELADLAKSLNTQVLDLDILIKYGLGRTDNGIGILENHIRDLQAEVRNLRDTTRTKFSIPLTPGQTPLTTLEPIAPAKVKVTWAPEPNLVEQSVYLQSDDGNLHFRPLGPLTEGGTNRTAEFDLGLLSDGISAIGHGNWQLLYTNSNGNLFSVPV